MSVNPGVKFLKTKNNLALKEWAVIVKVLTEGKQIIVARKGGIVEVDNQFKLQDNEFFLLPTFEHQDMDSILPEYLPDLMETINDKPSNRQISVSSYAKVEDIYKIHDLSQLEKLQKYFIWTYDSIAKRFNWNKDRILYLLTLRVYRLVNPCIQSWDESYAGCTSWITLPKELSLDGLKPVLSDEEFNEQRRRIKNILNSSL